MRIGVNALAVSPERPGGDARYVLEMVRRLPHEDPETEWVIFVAAAARHLFGDLPPNGRYVVCPVPSRSLVVRALWEQSALVTRAIRARLDVLFAPVNVLPLAYPGKMVLTLHEAEPFMPDSGIPWPLLAWWRTMRRLSALRAARILTVSHAARDDLIGWMGIPRERLRVVHLGVDMSRFSVASHGSEAPLHTAPYILWVGRAYPSKNLDTLLSAFSALRRSGRRERLVLIGPPAWNDARLRRRIETDIEPGSLVRVSATWSELPHWYVGAAVFAFPSLRETFGLPVLESMACGTPVVAGDVPALREVGGEAVEYVAPTAVDELSQALNRFLTDGQHYAEKRDLGLRRAATFNWEHTAQATYDNLVRAGDR